MKIWYAMLVTLSCNPSYSQNNLGPRLMAMGAIGTVIPDVWTVQANPAALADVQTTILSLAYQKHLFSAEINTQSVAAAHPFQQNILGLSIQRYGFSAYSENQLSFSYAKKFGSHFALGLAVRYHQLKIEGYGSNTAFSVDAGIHYHVNPYLQIGAYLGNLSRQAYGNKIISLSIPSTFNLGLSYLFSNKVLMATAVEKGLHETLDLRFGLEYKVMDLLKLRAGLSTKPFKQYAGFGLYFKKFTFDVATVYDVNLGYAPQISIGYEF